MSHPLSSATMTSPLMMQISEGEDLINPSKSAAHQSDRIHLHGRHPHHPHRQDVATRPPRGPANPGGGDDIANMMVSYRRRQARGDPEDASHARGEGREGSGGPRRGGRIREREREAAEARRERNVILGAATTEDQVRFMSRASENPTGRSSGNRLFDPEHDAIPRAPAADDHRRQERRDRERPLADERRRQHEARAQNTETSSARHPPGQSSAPQRHHEHRHQEHAGSASRSRGRRDDDFGHRHRHESRRDDASQTDSNRGPQVGGTRGGAGQLFDPRRDDPVKFAAASKRPPAASSGPSILSASQAAAGAPGQSEASATSVSDAKSLSSAPPSTNAPSVTSSQASRERRRRRGAAPSENSEADEGQAGARQSSHTQTNKYVSDAKSLLKEISTLESQLKDEHAAARQADEGRARGSAPRGRLHDGSVDHDFWLKLAAEHKRLAEQHAAFMDKTLRPGLPASLQNMPLSCRIPKRLWETGVQPMLERLLHALPISSTSATSADVSESTQAVQVALLEHLTEFVYFAYSFYTHLLEVETFKTFRASWLQSLGDLARYRMAVAGLSARHGATSGNIRNKAGRSTVQRAEGTEEDSANARQPADEASVGSAALGDWELEEEDTWRATARDWYAKGLAETPGQGRLHHFLGVLSQGDDLRVLHHFFKSLSSSHPHLASRESLLPLFDRVHQQRRVQPDASPISLFIHLHGILFTRVQLDDFDDVFDRFREALHAQALDGVRALRNTEPTPHEIPNYAWMMMGTINLAALLQYGAEDALLAPNDSQSANQKAEQREILGNVATGPAASQEASGSSPGLHTLRLPQAASVHDAEDRDVPVTLRHAIRLAFTVLDIVAACSIADRAPGQIVPPNPYLSIMLTFLTTAIKQPETLGIIERHIPWDQLVLLSKSATPNIDPRRDIASKVAGDAPLPEDWCLRGMSWVGRRVYERGFWKSQGAHSALVFESEVDVLACNSARNSLGAQEEAILGLDEGPDDEDAPARRNEHPGASGRKLGLRALRWRRISWTLTVLAKTVPGLDYEPALDGGRGGIVIVDPLRTKQQRWRTEDAEAQIQTQTARLGLGEVEPLEAEEGDEVDDDSPASELEEDVDQATDSAEIIQLKARRRKLKAILRAAQDNARTRAPAPALSKPDRRADNKKPAAAGKSQMPGAALLPGYSILVLDTNIALTQGDVLEQLIDSMQWTLIIPLAVITELDGIKKNQNAVGQEATRALSLIEARLRTHAKFVKVQTSRGNYLPDLRFRNEDIDFSGIGKRTDDDRDDGTFARSLDEIILRAVAWQDAHFVDRRTLLGSSEPTKAVAQGTAKVALVTFDRNLRLKARIRGSHSIGRAELLAILAPEKG